LPFPTYPQYLDHSFSPTNGIVLFLSTFVILCVVGSSAAERRGERHHSVPCREDLVLQEKTPARLLLLLSLSCPPFLVLSLAPTICGTRTPPYNSHTAGLNLYFQKAKKGETDWKQKVIYNGA
jgi:hypothetical protein